MAMCLSLSSAGFVNAQLAQASQNVQTPTTNAQHILVVGDSLSAAYGIERELGWVELLKKRLHTMNPQHQVTNASISGDTTSGGASRLSALLENHQPSIVIIELGANDALRGLPLSMSQQNLTKMIEQVQHASAQPVLIGMQIPPNYGPAYTNAFKTMFADVAQNTGASFVPFLLKGIEMDRNLFIEDGIHPSAQAQPQLLENVWAVFEPLLD